MSNSPARADIIRSTIERIVSLEGERNALSADIRQIKQTVVKGDLDMKISDFNAALRLYKLEGDDRTTFFDTLRETFNALGVGEQLDWINATEKSDGPAEPEPFDADTRPAPEYNPTGP